APGNVALQESVLIVVEVTVEDGKIDPTGTNASAVRAICIVDSGIFKFHVLDRHVAAGKDPDPLSVRDMPGRGRVRQSCRIQNRTGAVRVEHADQTQVACIPLASIVVIAYAW